MNTILCFGDSNTYGYNPKNGKRFPYDVRWTGILNEKLRAEQKEIEDLIWDPNKYGEEW